MRRATGTGRLLSAIAVLVSLAGCGSVEIAHVGQPSSELSTSPTRQLPYRDVDEAPVRGELGVEDVREAIRHLLTRPAMTMTQTVAGSNGIDFVDTVMFDPTSDVRWVSTDLNPIIVQETMRKLPAEEVMERYDPALVTNYVVDGTHMWMPVDDYVRFVEAECEFLKQEDDSLSRLPCPDQDPADWEGRWMSTPYDPGSHRYPSNFGPGLDIDRLLSPLRDLKIVHGEFVDGDLVNGVVAEGLEAEEFNRTATTVLMDVGVVDWPNASVFVTIDGEGRVRSVELGRMKFEFEWTVDPSVMVLPPPEARLTVDEIAGWLNMNPSCVTDQTSIVDRWRNNEFGC